MSVKRLNSHLLNSSFISYNHHSDTSILHNILVFIRCPLTNLAQPIKFIMILTPPSSTDNIVTVACLRDLSLTMSEKRQCMII